MSLAAALYNISEDSFPSSALELKLIPMTETVDTDPTKARVVQATKDTLSRTKKPASDEDFAVSPIEEVQMTVGTTDDPSLPCLTFRTLILGVTANILITMINTFFLYRTEPLHVSAIAVQIAAFPLGRLMARVLPRDPIGFPFNPRWRFSLNPGPFNVKEHVLITIFAYTGSNAMGIMLVNVVKAFYKRKLDFVPSLLFVLATQIMGYGSAGLYRKLLVEPAPMWWPQTLVNVSLFRTLHEVEPKRTFSRVQFFGICLAVSFAYYILPGYFFNTLTAISVACFLWPRSVTAQQIGSGLRGLGVGSFSLDWATISAFRGSPLGVPFFALANAAVGFILYLYVIIPIAYWGLNLYEARKFPIFSSRSFADTGAPFDIRRVLTQEFTLNLGAYNEYSKLHLSILYAMTNAMGFAVIGAALTHVVLFHGKDICKQTRSAISDGTQDIHTRLMQRYKPVPHWWFGILLIIALVLSTVGAEVYKDQLQLPWWGVLLGFAIGTFFALPFGVLVATANQAPGISVLSEMIMGYILPGQPVANICFRVYGSSNLMHTIQFLSDFKLGHYMKIPPRTMFAVQVGGSALSALIGLLTAWFLLETIPNICDPALLPPGSPWTCPVDSVQFTASVIWGLIGPARTFGPQGAYNKLNWFFLVGVLAPVPVYIATRVFPKVAWLRWVNMPIILIGGLTMPPASPVNNIMWLSVGMLFNGFIFRRRKRWWKRYNYLLSAALDAGTAFMGILLWMVFDQGVGVLQWWGTQGDHCAVAHCPTADGVVVKGCPVF